MKSSLLSSFGLFLLWAGVSVSAPAQSLSTGPLSQSTFCAGSEIAVPFTASGSFGADNVFIAQLSAPDGTFSAFANIGSLKGNISGAIVAEIPSDYPAGEHFRVRVVASEPATIGMDNGTDIIIVAKPRARIFPYKEKLAVGESVTFQHDSSGAETFHWDFGDGAMPATFLGANPPAVTYTTLGRKSIRLLATSRHGCQDSTFAEVEVFGCNPTIPPNAMVVTGEVTGGGGGGGAVWVKPGGRYNIGGGGSQTIFVEPGGAVKKGSSGSNIIYLKEGASYDGGDGGGGSNVIIHHPGAGIINSGHSYVLKCDDLSFTVPVAGIEPYALRPDAVFHLYPNPASATLHVDLAGLGARSVTLNDMLGNVAMAAKPDAAQMLALDLGGLPEGAYLLVVRTATGSIARAVTIQR